MTSLEQNLAETTPAFISNQFRSLSIADQSILEDVFNRAGNLPAETMLTREDLHELVTPEQMLEIRHNLNELSAVQDAEAKRKLAQAINAILE